MSIYDRLVPTEALRWGALTRPWPQLDLWCRANPAIGDRIDPGAVWAEFERRLIDGRGYGESYSRDDDGRPPPQRFISYEALAAEAEKRNPEDRS